MSKIAHGLIDANKHDNEGNKVIKFSPYNEVLSLEITEGDCEMLNSGECPILAGKDIKCHCTEILRDLKNSNFIQFENKCPELIYEEEHNYYSFNDGQHRACIASMLKMDIMIKKKIAKGLGLDIETNSIIIVVRGIPHKNAPWYDRLEL